MLDLGVFQLPNEKCDQSFHLCLACLLCLSLVCILQAIASHLHTLSDCRTVPRHVFSTEFLRILEKKTEPSRNPCFRQMFARCSPCCIDSSIAMIWDRGIDTTGGLVLLKFFTVQVGKPRCHAGFVTRFLCKPQNSLKPMQSSESLPQSGFIWFYNKRMLQQFKTEYIINKPIQTNQFGCTLSWFQHLNKIQDAPNAGAQPRDRVHGPSNSELPGVTSGCFGWWFFSL